MTFILNLIETSQQHIDGIRSSASDGFCEDFADVCGRRSRSKLDIVPIECRGGRS